MDEYYYTDYPDKMPKRQTIAIEPCPVGTQPTKRNLMRSNFDYNTQQAKIQGLSIQVGELFAEVWSSNGTPEQIDNALTAYKSLRRMLPFEEWDYTRIDRRHIGATAAHKATQKIN